MTASSLQSRDSRGRFVGKLSRSAASFRPRRIARKKRNRRSRSRSRSASRSRSRSRSRSASRSRSRSRSRSTSRASARSRGRAKVRFADSPIARTHSDAFADVSPSSYREKTSQPLRCSRGRVPALDPVKPVYGSAKISENDGAIETTVDLFQSYNNRFLTPIKPSLAAIDRRFYSKRSKRCGDCWRTRASATTTKRRH